MSVRPRLLAGLALALLLVACRPLYLPPVPEPPPFEPGSRVAAFDAGLEAGRPRLEVELADVTEAGWLAVQWLAPNGREAASGSVWVEPEAPRALFVLPADVEAVAGEWRAVVSLHGRLLRQFTFVIEPG
ncbi:MAG: hypothetical protein GX560_01345 [Deinococcales bacterium]|nr:hypothetical protein [Deinococcales bacterium]